MTDEPARQTLEQRKLQALFDAAADGIVVIDAQGSVESMNPAAEKLFGYTAAQVVGRNVKMLMPSPYSEEHDQYIGNYCRTGHKKIIGIGREVVGLRNDGTVFPLYLSVSEFNYDGQRFFTGILHDLTQLRSAEQQATQFGRMLEDSLNEIYIFDAESLRFLMVNRGAVDNIGYSAVELAELTPVDIKPQFSLDEFQKLLQPLRSGDRAQLVFDSAHQRRDGTLYDVHVRLQKTVWDDRDAFVAIILDVTEQKRRETLLRIRNKAIQAANEGIMIADVRQTGHPIIFVNHAFEEMSGYSADEAVGRGCDLICGSSPDERAVQRLQQAVANQEEFCTTIHCARRNGEMFWNEISVAPVLSDDGTATHLVAVMEDVSERREAQQQKLQSERLAAIGQMVTGLAHESRNALQRAQACLDMLALDLEGQPEQLNLTHKTHRALNDLHRYYEEVRNYAAPLNLERHQVDVARLWRVIWRDLEAVRFGRDFELIEQTPAEPVICRLDEHRMGQVFRNIMENAVAACPDPGRLTVSCSIVDQSRQPFVRISFHDNGPGFDADAAKRVFQPFFTTKQKGTGLGMAIAHRIVEAHGGSLEIGDTGGSGAQILVTIPLNDHA